MISETEIIDQWIVIVDCIAKPDESTQALELLTTSMFTEPGCRDVFKAILALQADGLPTDINHLIEQLESDGT
ncbi:MAG TPA: DnaB-like helicase N-terminal domain-containing protein [Planctomycetaceae bacterium]|nr:DnaB-like helicase N-terminal domain-containing protein [Planctomycetaceae bacterium]